MTGSPQMSIYIDRSPSDVFAYVLDIERTPQWRPRMSGARWLDQGSGLAGDRFRVDVRMLGIPFAFELEVTDIEQDRLFAYRQATGLVKVDASMEWRADGAGCRFFIGGDLSSDNLVMRLSEPIFRSSLLWQNYKDLLRLKALLEGHAARS